LNAAEHRSRGRVIARAVVAGEPGTPDYYLRCATVFEAPIGPHDWLNKAIFIGTDRKAVRVRVYMVT